MKFLAVGLVIVLQAAAQDCNSTPPSGGGGTTPVAEVLPSAPKFSAQRTLLAEAAPAMSTLTISEVVPRNAGGVVVVGLGSNADLATGVLRVGTVAQATAIIAAYDENSQLLWNRALSRWPDGYWETGMPRVAAAADGSIIAVVKARGPALDFGGGTRFCTANDAANYRSWCMVVVKYNAAGQYLWDRVFTPETPNGGTCNLELGGVATGADGSVYIHASMAATNACDFGGGVRLQPGSETTVVLGLTSLGVYKWDRLSTTGAVFPSHLIASAPAFDTPLGITVTDAGNVVVLGTYAGASRNFGGGVFPAALPAAPAHYVYLVGYKADGTYAWGSIEEETGGIWEQTIKTAARLTDNGANVFAHINGAIVARKGSDGALLWRTPAPRGAITAIGTVGVLLTARCVTGTDFGGGTRTCPTAINSSALVAYNASGKYGWDKILPAAESQLIFDGAITTMNGNKRFIVMSSFGVSAYNRDLTALIPITYDAGGGPFTGRAGTNEDAYFARFDSVN